MPATIRVRLLCFSHVRDALGTGAIELTLPANACAADAAREVKERGRGRLDGMPMRIAVNRAFVGDDAPLADGDEVALIPPVQGG